MKPERKDVLEAARAYGSACESYGRVRAQNDMNATNHQAKRRNDAFIEFEDALDAYASDGGDDDLVAAIEHGLLPALDLAGETAGAVQVDKWRRGLRELIRGYKAGRR